MSEVFVATGAARRRWGMATLAISVMVLAVSTQVGPATAQTTPPPPTLTKTVIVAGDNVGVHGQRLRGWHPRCRSNSTPSRWSRRRARPAVPTPLSWLSPSQSPRARTPSPWCARGRTAPSPPMPRSRSAPRPRPVSRRNRTIVVAIILLMVGGVCLVATNRRRLQPAKVRSR